MKPLGGKAYGSIPHLPGSRLGPGDHSCSPGQALIATVGARDKKDRIIVQEKLDGSCVAAAMLEDGSVVALGRAGHLAQSSPYEQHQLFAAWVRKHEQRFREVLIPGMRIVGEWLAQAHGTLYDLRGREPFVAFDLIQESGVASRRTGMERYTLAEAGMIIGRGGFTMPKVLNAPDFRPMPIRAAMQALAKMTPCDIGPGGRLTYGFHGSLEEVEGAIWRVEREHDVDFLCKFVRPGKVDGCYLPPKGTNNGIVWNWRPSMEQQDATS